MNERANGRTTVPQIFIGETHVGGCDELHALEGAGKLDPLLAGDEGIRHDRTAAFKAATGPDALGAYARPPMSTPPRA